MTGCRFHETSFKYPWLINRPLSRAPDMSNQSHKQVMAGVFFAGLSVTPACAEMDPKTRGSLQYLHKSMLLVEQNLKLATEKKDFQRVALANDLLFTYRRLSGSADGSNSCLEALNGLEGVAFAIAFEVHPFTQDPSDRFSKTMRPSREMLAKTYGEGRALYGSKIAACEEEINHKPTPRLLPEKMPLTR